MFALIAHGEINFARCKRTVEVVDSMHYKKTNLLWTCNRLPAVDNFLRLDFSHRRYRINDGCGEACVSQAKIRVECRDLLQLGERLDDENVKVRRHRNRINACESPCLRI